MASKRAQNERHRDRRATLSNGERSALNGSECADDEADPWRVHAPLVMPSRVTVSPMASPATEPRRLGGAPSRTLNTSDLGTIGAAKTIANASTEVESSKQGGALPSPRLRDPMYVDGVLLTMKTKSAEHPPIMRTMNEQSEASRA